MNIRIHYNFVIYIFILFFLGLLKYFSIFFISILIHESTHAIIGYIFGLKVTKLDIDMCGISVNFNNLNINYIKRIIVYISGPLMNLLVLIVTYEIFKEKYTFFILTNLILFLFNIIPIYPLDGGKILYEIVNKFFYSKKVILKKIYSCIQVLFLGLLACFCINFSNIQLFFIGMYFLKFAINDNYKNILIF